MLTITWWGKITICNYNHLRWKYYAQEPEKRSPGRCPLVHLSPSPGREDPWRVGVGPQLSQHSWHFVWYQVAPVNCCLEGQSFPSGKAGAELRPGGWADLGRRKRLWGGKHKWSFTIPWLQTIWLWSGVETRWDRQATAKFTLPY